jgi:hypothetical protein
VSHNPRLESLEALGSLRTTDILHLDDDPSVTTLRGFENLSRCGTISVSRMSGLSDVDGLAALRGDVILEIVDNAALTSLSALASARPTSIRITANGALATLDGLDRAGDIVSLWLADNPLLTDLESLRNLTRIRSFLKIQNNDALTSIAGLRGLTSVGNLSVLGNNRLENLDGLAALAAVGDPHYGGDVDISTNLVLDDLRGLAGLESIRQNLVIQYNPSLPTCEADWLRDHVGSIGGDVTIHGNNDGGTCP